MVTWIVFKNHLFEVGLAHNRETIALLELVTVDLFHFFLSCVRIRMNRNSLEWHLVKGLVTYDFTLDLRVCGHST